MRGFETEAAAREAGEKMRTRMRLLNTLLSLGITVPTGDSPDGGVDPQVKENLLKERDAVAIDSIWGVTTYPDDGRHLEYVVGGNIQVRPSDPNYLLVAIKTIWELDLKLDEASEDALNILNLAATETSEKAAFLTTYLALEQLITKRSRDRDALALLDRFQRQIKKAGARKRRPLAAKAVSSLRSALGTLREESFKTALLELADRLAHPRYEAGRLESSSVNASTCAIVSRIARPSTRRSHSRSWRAG